MISHQSRPQERRLKTLAFRSGKRLWIMQVYHTNNTYLSFACTLSSSSSLANFNYVYKIRTTRIQHSSPLTTQADSLTAPELKAFIDEVAKWYRLLLFHSYLLFLLGYSSLTSSLCLCLYIAQQAVAKCHTVSPLLAWWISSRTIKQLLA